MAEEKKKLNLMLHCGGYRVDRDEVKKIATPERGRVWVPIPHPELLELVERTLKFSGFTIEQEAHALAREGNRYFGMIQVGRKNEEQGDAGLVVGLRNSHDQSFPAGLLLGEGPFVCDNLSFSGDVTLARKHTTHIRRDLPRLVEEGMGRLFDLRYDQEKRISAYRETSLEDRDAHHLAILGVDARVVANAKIPEVLREWREPSHEEFAPRTVWSLYNAFTEVMKGVNLFDKPRSSAALHGVLDAHVGLSTRKAG